ncbi:MAG: hypothetical protein HFH26_11830 [Clostridiaceae bacterium]|nr:hypothetical protein [Clostridiaceae bacterium]
MEYYRVYPLTNNYGSMYNCGLLYLPNYTPRKAEFGKMLSETGGISEDQKQTVSSLSPEQKERFRKQLHYGNGDMTLQEWDDFLADLVEHGIITNDERFYANGSFYETPEGVLRGDADARTASSDVVDHLWDGNPLKWLNQMDAYFLQNSFYRDMRCAYGTGYSGQRDAYVGTQKILKEILSDGADSAAYKSSAKDLEASENVRARAAYSRNGKQISVGTSLATLNQQQLNMIQNSLYENMKSAMFSGGSERKDSGLAATQRVREILNQILW